jgi:hypothetical protein
MLILLGKLQINDDLAESQRDHLSLNLCDVLRKDERLPRLGPCNRMSSSISGLPKCHGYVAVVPFRVAISTGTESSCAAGKCGTMEESAPLTMTGRSDARS